MSFFSLKRGALVALLSLTGFSYVLAKPASGRIIIENQPDGTTIEIRLNGDEFFHYLSTVDGYPLLLTHDGSYNYARINEDGAIEPTGFRAHNPNMRSASELQFISQLNVSNDIINRAAHLNRAKRKGPGLKSDNFPTKGEHPALVLLVEFQDVKFDTYNKDRNKYSMYSDDENGVYRYWNDMLNKQGFDGFGGTGSCRDWFIQNSTDAEGNPQFIPTFDVFGPITLPGNVADYGRNNNNNDDMNPQQMVIDACSLLDDQIDFSKYDRNGDGEVDNIFIFFAGYGEADAGAKFADTIWPHSWDLTKGNQQFVMDGVTINHYACSNETDYFMNRPDGIGTFVHEFSHVLGLPDLYATQQGSTAYTPGEYSVLDYGPYNNNGRTPPNYSAFERYALDWLNPAEYGESGEYTLGNIAETNRAYIVKTAADNEYFLIENRQNSGWDMYIPGHGMIIWHIDYDPAIFKTNSVNNTANHQYVDLVEANKRYQSKYASGHTFPGENNVTTYTFSDWNRKSCGISLSNISESGDGMISMYVENENSGVLLPVEQTASLLEAGKAIYNLQGARITNPQHGDIVICDGRKIIVTK